MRLRALGMLSATLGVTVLACGSTAPITSREDAAGDAPPPDGSAPDAGFDASFDASFEVADPSVLDPGWAGLRRLSDVEYANTVNDLLGVTFANGTVFVPDDSSDVPDNGFESGFDNMASAPAISPRRYENYFAAALALVTQTFADPALRARIVTCVPTSPVDTACEVNIIRAFGLRAWRRPLDADEVNGLAALAQGARAAGADFPTSIQRVVTAMLASESFLHRIELDLGADPTKVHVLTPYELASRLSYLLWSTMPDATLFELADTGALSSADVVAAQVTRMLADPRAREYVRNFAGQWLGFRALDTHEVDVTMFPAWNDDLRRAMQDEASLYVSEYLQNDRSMATFLTDDFHFVDGALATVYGLPAPADTGQLVRVEGTTDGRKGYLGLAAFLTVTSLPATTLPTARGAAILQSLLCVDLGAPSHPLYGPSLGTPREQLAQVVQEGLPCAACHGQADPIGLGLENFDAIGQFRTKYATGDFLEIDPTGGLPDGTSFAGLPALADLLQGDPRFLDCVTRKALVYTLGRALVDDDEPQLMQIHAAWDRGGLSLRSLLGAIVVSDTFRLRRGESP